MEWLKELDVLDFGYTEESIPQSTHQFNTWIENEKHGPLAYLTGERQEKRQDIKNHWPEFQSALVCLFSYHSVHSELNELTKSHPDWNGLKVASYTLGFQGLDYHDFLKIKLVAIGERLKAEYQLEYKLTLDVHPVLERDLAYRSGLGWFGKNSMMINTQHGSFLIIGSLLLSKKLPISLEVADTDHCGQCNMCVEACPTNAIDAATRTIIAKDCISTFTIEQFKLDTEPTPKMDLTSGFIFGCDICQDVCPWNKRLDRLENREAVIWTQDQKKILNFFMLKPVQEVYGQLDKMSNGEYAKYFEKTSFSRSGKRGLLKNLKLYLKQKLNIFS